MGDKFQNKSKHSKKSTAKDKKAENHLKIMQGGKDKTQATANVAAEQKDKKAA